jgi:hypothetical protein
MYGQQGGFSIAIVCKKVRARLMGTGSHTWIKPSMKPDPLMNRFIGAKRRLAAPISLHDFPASQLWA